MKLSKKIIIPVAIAVVLLAVYFGGMVFYSQRYLPDTKINGTSYGGKTVENVLAEMNYPFSNNLELKGRGEETVGLVLSEKHYNKKVDIAGLESIMQAQRPYLWFIEGLFPKDYTINNQLEFDSKRLEETLLSSRLFDEDHVVPPKDAYIEETEEEFFLVPEEKGNALILEKVLDIVVSSLKNGGDVIDLEAEECYQTPEITEDSPQLQKLHKEMQAIGKLVITYDFSDRQEVLDYDLFSPWVSYDIDKGILVDKDEAENFVVNLAQRYDTYRINREFRPTELAPIHIGGGIYGWQTNVKETTQQLIEAIKAGESVMLEPIYITRGLHRGVDDLGDTYVEVDLTRQRMWLYVEGEMVVDSGIVSGAPTVERETPTGVFSIWSKETKRYISGEDYKFWVEYWMPIDWAGTGIHDAPWQSNFGGTQYLISGSHGCINTPIENVIPIFNNVQINTPVVVYKS